MNIGRATAILINIESDKFTDDEKAEAIYEVINMPTHNGITKATLLKALKWAFEQCWDSDDFADQAQPIKPHLFF